MVPCAGPQAGELGSQPNFRVRVMPVLPPTPAAFGAALAAHALALLAAGGAPARPPPRPVPALTVAYQKKLYQRFVNGELKAGRDPREPRISIDDVGLLVCEVFRCRCALTGVRFDSPDRPGFRLCRWEPRRGATLDNMLFATNAAADRHEHEGPQALPPCLVAEIQRSFAAALGGRRRPLFLCELQREELAVMT